MVLLSVTIQIKPLWLEFCTVLLISQDIGKKLIFFSYFSLEHYLEWKYHHIQHKTSSEKCQAGFRQGQ